MTRHFLNTNNDRSGSLFKKLNYYSDHRVLIGDWFDRRIQKNKDDEEYNKALARNDLPFQKWNQFINTITKPIKLTRNFDGFLHHGDVTRLRWKHEANREIYFLNASPSAVAEDGSFNVPCMVTANSETRVIAKNALHVFRYNPNVMCNIPLSYGETIFICTTQDTGYRVMNCEPKSFFRYAEQSRHLEVTFVKELSGRCLWRVNSVNKRDRLRTQGSYIQVNTDIVICNVYTGENLTLELKTNVKTRTGSEKEISGYSYFNQQKNHKIENIWQFEAPVRCLEDYGNPIEFPT